MARHTSSAICVLYCESMQTHIHCNLRPLRKAARHANICPAFNGSKTDNLMLSCAPMILQTHISSNRSKKFKRAKSDEATTCVLH
eukprot:6177906-Pleurochrysis_carterae.AAC.1